MMTGRVEVQLEELDRAIEAFVMETQAQFAQLIQSRHAAIETRLEAIERELAEAPKVPLGQRASTPTPAARQPQMSSEPTLALPDPLTWRSLDAFLRDQGFRVMDNRSSNAAYWVLDDGQRFEPVRRLLRAKGVSCEFKATRKRYQGPSYWVDTGNCIPE